MLVDSFPKPLPTALVNSWVYLDFLLDSLCRNHLCSNNDNFISCLPIILTSLSRLHFFLSLIEVSSKILSRDGNNECVCVLPGHTGTFF